MSALIVLATLSVVAVDAAQVQKYLMTKPKPTAPCSELSVNPPLGYMAFSTGEPEAYLWFYVTDLKAGDVLASEYTTPTGRLHSEVSWPFRPVESAGNWCFTDAQFRIAGGLPASNQGVWTVKVTLNGAALFSLNFTIGTMTIALSPGVGGPATGGGGTAPAAGSNLIANPGAEAGPASSSYSGMAAIPGWIADGKATVAKWGADLSATAPGPADRGANFFGGGSADRSMIYQTIDVSSSAAQIDAGTLPYTLSGWLGGYASQDDNVKVTATFKGSGGQTLAVSSIGPVLAAERQNVSSLLFKSATGTVPAGTRSIVVDQVFTRTSGSANDGYADSLSLTFASGTTTPGGGTTPFGGGSVGAFTNGGFELPGTGNRLDQGPGSTHITGWNIPRGTVDYLNAAGYVCSEGRACIDLDGNTAGAMAQTFATTPGSAYQVMFDQAGNPDGGDKVKRMRVSAAGQSQEFSFDATGRSWTSPGWSSRSWSFTASSASTTLEFASLGPAGSSYGPLLDNIRVNTGTGGTGGTGGTTTVMGANLIVNPGAEAGPVSPSCSGVASIPGWTTSAGRAGVCPYGSSGGYPAATTPGPSDRGSNLFTGGGSSSTLIQQTIDVSSSAAQIDAGGLPYVLSGWLGGYDSDDDNVKVTATFKGSSGQTLGTASIGPVLAAERRSVMSLLSKSANGTLPAGTRSILVEMLFTRTSGSANDGYADNLSLTIAGTGGATPGGGGTTPVTGANLIVNPGAESGPSDADCGAVASIPGWTTAGIVAVCRYGWTYVPVSVPGAPDRGNQFFGGGYAARSSITQVIDLSSYAATIDAGTPYTLSAWLGGWETQGDNAKLTATFRGAGGSALGAASVGPVTMAERNSITAFLLRSASGSVPSGTRSVLVELEFNRTDGNQNDGYADNLSLTLAGTGGGGGTTPPPAVCSYNVPASSTVAGAGGTGMVLVTTASTCAWTATSNAAWITITAGASGLGNGAVSYRATANPGSAARTGTLTVAGVTHTVTQGAGAAACSYSLNSSSTSVAAAGGTTAVVVNTTSGCTWTAGSNADWITIASGASGSGSGTVSLRVAPNTGASSRTGTVTVAGRTFTVTQAGQPAAGGPAIARSGVVNAASYISAALPSGAIARGSFFSIFGTDLGPAQYAQATSYPIQTTLAEVSIRVTQGSNGVNALPVFVAATQINGVMPSNTPLGEVQVTVTYRGRTSAPATIRVVASNFGAFSTAGGRGPGIFQNYISATEQPLNTRGNSATPSQVVTLWGTGLGAIGAPDDMPPPAGDLPIPVEIYVAGKLARKLYSGRAPCCAGVDQIVFELPPDTPSGCTIPVQVKSGTAYSNIVTMAVSPNGGACQETINPLAPVAERGGKVGVVILARANASLELEAGKPPTDLTLDLGAGLFQQFAAGGELGYNPLLSYPPMGTCTNFSGNLDLGGLLGSGTSAQDPTGFSGRALNAGPQLTVTGPGGNSIPLPRFNEDSPTGPYGALLGTSQPIGDGPALPLFLNPGRFTVRGPGGSDVGAFSVSLDVPRGVTWTDRNRLSQVNRDSAVSFNWTGGGSSQIVLIGGASTDQKNQVAAGFFCAVPAAQGSFTVPPNVLGNLPASVGEEAEQTVGVLMMGTIPAAPFQTFTASGLDQGLAVYFFLDAKTVPYK
ncbi:MAG: choice-of-anchor C family protein [Acidobacteria bacterium]|nr:choice-of-anchor C family protein [Acidobacteriota bacterium]